MTTTLSTATYDNLADMVLMQLAQQRYKGSTLVICIDGFVYMNRDTIIYRHGEGMGRCAIALN